jgi:competence protein ComEA
VEPQTPRLARPEIPPSTIERARSLVAQTFSRWWPPHDWPLRNWLLAAGIVATSCLGVGYLVLERSAPGPPIETTLPLATPTAATSTLVPAELVVHAAGAVVQPGLRVVATGARVADVVSAAGGLTMDADLDRVNLAALVSDAQRIYVPRVGEAVPATVDPGAGSGGSEAEPVDINSADAAALESLPGVGPATAGAIIDWRSEAGRFNSVEDLLEVPGIGPAKLEQLRDRVTV